MILVFPWARKTTDGKLSPKDYPHWKELIVLLHARKYETHQISLSGEADLACTKRSDNLPLNEIGALLRSAATWISVDSFAPHMAWSLGEPGIAIFGLSDPWIYGHQENINLLKDRYHLRKRQFGLWSQEPIPKANIFVSPEVVAAAVELSIKARKNRIPVDKQV